MALIDAVGDGPVALDTCAFIYLVEQHDELHSIVEPVFRAIDRGALHGVASELTLLETLVRPYRLGQDELAAEYEALLTRSTGLTLLPMTRAVLRASAQLRGLRRVGIGDAVHLTTAIAAECACFITNDRRLPPLGPLRVLQLNEFL